jgi:hypothetical protein
LFAHTINSPEEYERMMQEQTRRQRQGLVPDFMITSRMGGRTLADLKTLHVGTSTYTNASLTKPQGAVNKRAGLIHRQYHGKLRKIDLNYNNAQAGVTGPSQRKLAEFGRIRGFVIGAYGEISTDLKDYLKELAATGAEMTWRDMGARTETEARGLITGMLYRSIGIATVRGHARLKLDRLASMQGDAAEAARRRATGRFNWAQRRNHRASLNGFARESARMHGGAPRAAS